MKSKFFTKAFAITVVVCSIFILNVNAQAEDVLLKQNMNNEDVKQVQIKLKALGYFNEETTGYFGEVTKSAVEKFQKAKGFTPDGVVGPGTWNALIGNKKATSSLKNVSFDGALEQGMQSDQVSAVQTKLKKAGFFKEEVTGYFGDVTEKAVMNFQKSKGLVSDGVVGSGTWNKLFGTSKSTEVERQTVSRGSVHQGESLVSWEDAQDIFNIGTVATVFDIETGISFDVKRTFGENHADSETLTYEDSQKMKKAFGGNWSQDKRAIIITVKGRQIAASIYGEPHAGLDSETALEVISNRSGGYGRGQNLDKIKDNGMNGHVCIHFLNSRTHSSNKLDSTHQSNIREAAKYIEKH